jgi:hypothetical protein
LPYESLGFIYVHLFWHHPNAISIFHKRNDRIDIQIQNESLENEFVDCVLESEVVGLKEVMKKEKLVEKFELK